MASWLDSTLEAASADIEVDMTGVGLMGADGKEVPSIMCRPISAAEYQILKSDPELKGLTDSDKQELLGLKMTYEMLKKCDDSLTWGKFKTLPLILIGEIAQRVVKAAGSPSPDGGGVLGEL